MKPIVKKQKVEEEGEDAKQVNKSEDKSILSSDEYEDDDGNEPIPCYTSSDDSRAVDNKTPEYYSSDDSRAEDYKTPEYYEYLRKINESRGYDHPERPPGLKIKDNCSRVSSLEIVRPPIEAAINFYNEKNGTNYVFDSLVRANLFACSGLDYFLTFKASTTDSAAAAAASSSPVIHEFEARVLEASRMYITECTLKTMPQSKGEDEQSQHTHP